MRYLKFATLIFVLFSGCYQHGQITKKNMNKIEAGMSNLDVIRIAGKPYESDRQKIGDESFDNWKYKSVLDVYGDTIVNDYIHFHFVGGKLKSIEY
jgi:hypothetical protein